MISAKLFRSDLRILSVRLQIFVPFPHCSNGHLNVLQRLRQPESLRFSGFRACSDLSKPASQPVNPAVFEELDKHDDENDEHDELLELRDLTKPDGWKFKNGTEYKATFERLLTLELEHELLHKTEEESEKDIRQALRQELRALSRFERNKGKMNPEIYSIILGQLTMKKPKWKSDELDPDAYQTPNPIRLNQSSAAAVKLSLERPFTLIQGPPGSGKSQTAVAIVYNLHKNSLKSGKKKKRKQILVCANSNNVCDDLARKISEYTGLKVVRVVSKKREESYSSDLSAHQMAKVGTEKKLANYQELTGDDTSDMLESDKKRAKRQRGRELNRILDEADVIVTTCSMAGAELLRRKDFKILVIDEAAACREPELIVPLNKGVQKLVMIGDFQQLPPVIKSQEAAEYGLEQSLMQRLVNLGNYYALLDTQYRMHPLLSRFPSQHFYGGLLKDGVSEQDRLLPEKFRWPTSWPTFFYHCNEREQRSGPSYMNQQQGVVIGEVVERLVSSGIRPDQIGIITPYVGHREYLRTSLKHHDEQIDYDQIEIESINAFQGREKDIIILSTVRSNRIKGSGSLGFLRDGRRLNVALTRARRGLIIIGNEWTLEKDENWKALLSFYRENGLIVYWPVDL